MGCLALFKPRRRGAAEARWLDLPAALGKAVGFALEGQPIDADPALGSITRHHLSHGTPSLPISEMDRVVWVIHEVLLMRGTLEKMLNGGKKGYCNAGEALLNGEAAEGAVLPCVAARQSRRLVEAVPTV